MSPSVALEPAAPVEQEHAGVVDAGLARWAVGDDVEVDEPVAVDVARGERRTAVGGGEVPAGGARVGLGEAGDAVLGRVEEEPVGLVAAAEGVQVRPAVMVEIGDGEAPDHLVVGAGIAGVGGEGVRAAERGGGFCEGEGLGEGGDGREERE